MTTPQRPNVRMAATAERVARASARFTHALQLVQQVEADCGTSTTGERVHTSGVSDPTSQQALARLGAQEWREDLRDHLDDWVHTSDLFLSRVEDAIHWATSRLGLPVAPLAPVVLCSGEGYDGRELPWTPHSQDPRNGWHDPNCRDIATLRAGQQLKVCDRCLKRVESWRARNGLPALATLPARGAA